MLVKVLTQMDQSKFDIFVVTLIDGGELQEKLEAKGIRVYSIGFKKRVSDFFRVFKLINTLRSLRPNVLQAWLYHCNLLSCFLSFFLSNEVKICWNIRSSLHAFSKEKIFTKIAIQFGAYFSTFADLVLVNSKESYRQHLNFGYCSKNLKLLGNGFDTSIYKVDVHSREELRKIWNVKSSELLIGIVARVHREKGQKFFLSNFIPPENVKILIVGRGAKERDFKSFVASLPFADRVILEESRNDVHRVLNAVDILVSPSETDSFPNIVAESLLCGALPLATNVGDVSEIIRDERFIFRKRDQESFQSQIEQSISIDQDERRKISKTLSENIIENYSISKITKMYESLYL